MSNFIETPHHINATPDDLAGNHDIGRYILIPGSDGRAREIAGHFQQMKVKEHPRGHNLYTGVINDKRHSIDIAVIASGMGCPSMEIILHELFYLGARRFLRVGTAGSLQKDRIKIGDIVNVQASVRDESTTDDYAPHSVPAVASLQMIEAINQAGQRLNMLKHLHTGTVHCKSSFYAREFYAGPLAEKNKAYMNLLIGSDVLASEMETATLFIQSQIYHHTLNEIGSGSAFKVLAGAILGIGAIPPDIFMTSEQETKVTEQMIKLAIESVKVLAASEKS